MAWPSVERIANVVHDLLEDLREVAVQQRLQPLFEAWPQSSERFFEPDVVFILVADAGGREDLWHRSVVVLRAQLNLSCSDSDNES